MKMDKEKVKLGVKAAIVGSIITMIVGFALGGWLTSSTSKDMGEQEVISRLATICVAQFNQDPQKEQKVKVLKEKSAWDDAREKYISEQGWATMPGEKLPDRDVAVECVKRIMENAR